MSLNPLVLLLFGVLTLGCSALEVTSAGSAGKNHSWVVEDCIILQFNSSVFTLKPTVNTSLTVDIPSNALVVQEYSNCGNQTQVIALSWKWTNVNGTSLNHNITVEFHRNNDTKSYGIGEIYGVFNVGKWNETKKVGNETQNVTVTSYITMSSEQHSNILPTPLNRSYVCLDPGNVTLVSHYKVSTSSRFFTLKNTTLAVVGIKFDAFRHPNGTHGKFQSPYNCIENRVNDVVPIIVGCVLAFLIVFVLVAYVIGRRTPRSGYLSV
ncbi:uncharacterized protein Lamp1 [Lepeophtheirus salmonis]|uniref:Lysosome-associated membrane glycoprotein 2-like transmembrane domain-containing protein n=1 Tax=Lepeophtheirus salmonis TaxID=72036 RepID=A0A0K2T0V2_LEPSM|nr:lysosome-associated membrane glycoprotein 1-like [Lepeophtheirus salmonis]